jgi:L,D-peptidoglycan transpeptidase YkuD (ErfK/YbiS/YcfS/YnhG family)
MLLCALLQSAAAGPLPDEARQLVLVVVPAPDQSEAGVHLLARSAEGWQAEGGPMPARIGAEGVAWGIGLHPPQPGLQKVEGDNRSPAGLFRLGSAFRDATVAPLAVDWPVQLVGPRDLWVEDPRSPYYNLHLVVPGDRPLLPWEEASRMILGDPVLALKVFVAHNLSSEGPTLDSSSEGPLDFSVVPGAGSAIFLHTWGRDGAAATAGCTSVSRADLVRIVGWLRPEAAPVFALLTEAQLATLGEAWGLPQP